LLPEACFLVADDTVPHYHLQEASLVIRSKHSFYWIGRGGGTQAIPHHGSLTDLGNGISQATHDFD
jgi:hypothetical protein